MFGFLSKFPLFRLFKKRRKVLSDENDEVKIIEEKWTADFREGGRNRFEIKPEGSYDVRIQREPPAGRGAAGRNTLVLGLKKSHCFAWIEAPGYFYRDLVLEARFRLDPHGGYAAAGFLFRVMDEGTYYSILISSKGYFRLEAVRNGMPLPLIGWTELPPPQAGEGEVPGAAALTLIAYGSHILLAINGSWAGEVNDATLSSGELCFAAVSYEGAGGPPEPAYAAEAFLDFLSVDTRVRETAALYEQWTAAPRDPQSCFHLAETFAAMNQGEAALVQLNRAWEYSGGGRKPGELLFAGRLARGIGRFPEAEGYIDACISEGGTGPEARAALVEKAEILHGMKRFDELERHAGRALKRLPREARLHRLQGHAFRSRGDCEKAAAAYDRAFELDAGDLSSAEDAALMYEALDQPAEALQRYFQAGRALLAGEDYPALGALVPKLLALGEGDWEARGLVGKWAFGIEDWGRAEEEFNRAEKLRKKCRPRPKRDAAAVFLQGLLKIRGGKRGEALDLLEEAAALAPDYPLFRFRLAENRYLLSGDPGDPKLASDLKTALKLAPEDGWIHNFAAQLALARGDRDAAANHLDRARSALGDTAAIRVNQAVLADLRGDLGGALDMLNSGPGEDGEGTLANCAGNLLVRARRWEEAEGYYQKALAAAPDNREYLCNRASCLIEMGRYGAADEILSRACRQGEDPAVLELISYVASRKGEYTRAEAACRAALELDPCHGPSLLALGQFCLSQARWGEAEELVRRLEALPLTGDAAARRGELRERLEGGRSRLIPCASCKRSWRVPLSPPPAPPIRLFAMPPDDLPAGTCTGCGETYCIGCGKDHLDKNGRFVCPRCGKTLKLINEGLKRLVYDWASGALPGAAGGVTGGKPPAGGNPKPR